MLAEERHLRIVEMIQHQGVVTVSDIVRECEISEITARRDLDHLAQLNKIQRIRGGAKAVEASEREVDLNQRFLLHAAENRIQKENIGAFAASFIKDGDFVILDAGSTTLEIAKHLTGKKEVTVIVTSINLAQELEGKEGITTILTGGTLRSSTTSLLDPLLKQSLSQIYADKVFIGVRGISPTHGYTTNDFAEAEVKKLLFKSAKTVYVVADSSKFNRITAAHIGPIPDADFILTDKEQGEGIFRGFEPFEGQILMAEKRGR